MLRGRAHPEWLEKAEDRQRKTSAPLIDGLDDGRFIGSGCFSACAKRPPRAVEVVASRSVREDTPRATGRD
jgi:hypothetical protein